MLTSCGCSDGEALGLLWTGEPRVLPIIVSMELTASPMERLHSLNDRAVAVRPCPETPPPRDRRFDV